MEKWPVELVTRSCARALPQGGPCPRVQPYFMHSAHFTTKNIEDAHTEGWGLRKISEFGSSSGIPE